MIGASGLVGGALHARLARSGVRVTGTSHTHPRAGLVPFELGASTTAFLNAQRPDLVVLASAMTHVDRCESEPAQAQQRNVDDVATVAAWCRAHDAALVHFSTDYVFDGAAGPYAEDAPTHALSVYGQSKLDSEALVTALPRGLVIRITNVFDIGYDDRNFVHRCVSHLRDRKALVVPSDQLATPAYATWLAAQWVTLCERGAILTVNSPRLLHAGCDEVVSRGQLARRIAALLQADDSLIDERPTVALNQAAARPLRGGLRNDLWKRLLGVERLPLDDALADCLPRMLALYESRP
ncbi:MAG: SDR family oxidoreductase [Candidatus Eisenbacteria bacterium]